MKYRGWAVAGMIAGLALTILGGAERGDSQEDNFFIREEYAKEQEKEAELAQKERALNRREKEMEQDACMLACLEEGTAERIRLQMDDFNMQVFKIFPVGEDTSKHIRRFFACVNGFESKFYLVDYITDEIICLSPGNKPVYVSSVYGDEAALRTEDFDGDGKEDILLFFYDSNRKADRICLWLQREGTFLPVNSECCGKSNDQGDAQNLFSEEIYLIELQMERGELLWNIDRAAIWARETLFKGREAELKAVLEISGAGIPTPYWCRREAEEMHVSVVKNGDDQYFVSIPENLYSENRINNWFSDFYEKNREMSVTLSQERADDAVISFMGEKYTCTENGSAAVELFPINFDSCSGRMLKLSDVVTDEEAFFSLAMDYLQRLYGKSLWYDEEIRDSIAAGRFCMTGYGIRFFCTGESGLGMYTFDLPYELAADLIKTEYLPLSRAAELTVYDAGVQMDVNGDGLLEEVTKPVFDDGAWEIMINSASSRLDPVWRGQHLYELGEMYQEEIRSSYLRLVRDERGVTRLKWAFLLPGEENRIVFIWRIEGEEAVFEQSYEEQTAE